MRKYTRTLNIYISHGPGSRQVVGGIGVGKFEVDRVNGIVKGSLFICKSLKKIF